jgi:hypothetical protein
LELFHLKRRAKAVPVGTPKVVVSPLPPTPCTQSCMDFFASIGC